MTDFTPILNLTLHIIMLLPKKINVKRKRSHCLVAIFFFCHIDLHSGYAFHPTARKLYLNKLTLTVCLRNARTTYFFFRNDYLQPFQEGLKDEKEKKNPKQPEEKAIPSGPWRQNYVILTSVRRRHVALTSVRRYFDVLHLLECY